MCIEREIRTCIILNADKEKLDTLVTLANAIGVTAVYLFAKTQDLPALRDAGWEDSPERTLMVKVKP
jgi:hypothetical protein